MNIAAVGVRTSDQGLRTANGALFQANAGNDSIAFGDTLARVSATTFAGGASNDPLVVTPMSTSNGLQVAWVPPSSAPTLKVVAEMIPSTSRVMPSSPSA